MPFGYIGQNQPKQKVKNAGVLSSFEVLVFHAHQHHAHQKHSWLNPPQYA